LQQSWAQVLFADFPPSPSTSRNVYRVSDYVPQIYKPSISSTWFGFGFHLDCVTKFDPFCQCGVSDIHTERSFDCEWAEEF